MFVILGVSLGISEYIKAWCFGAMSYTVAMNLPVQPPRLLLTPYPDYHMTC